MKNFRTHLIAMFLNLLLLIKYWSGYIELHSENYNPDGVRFFVFFLPFVLLFISLIIYNKITRTKGANLYCIVSLFCNLLVVSNKGRIIPGAGIITCILLIVVGVVNLIILKKFFNSNKGK